MVQFLETTYYNIFKHLLATNSKNRGFFSLVFIHFGTKKTNGQKILYLHFLIRFYNAFHITYLLKQL